MINMIVLSGIGYLLYTGYLLVMQRQRLITLHQKHQSLENAMEKIEKNHPVLINADLVFAKKLNEINKQLVSMDNQLQDLANKRDNDGGYQHALRILEMGGSRDEIVTNCHLSSAEADLLMNLQAYRSAMKVVSEEVS